MKMSFAECKIKKNYVNTNTWNDDQKNERTNDNIEKTCTWINL